MNLRASDEINNLMPRTIWYVYCPNDNNCSFKSIQVLPTEKDKVFTFNGNEYCDVLVSPYPAFYDYYANPDQFLVLHFRSEDSRVYCFDEEKKEDVLMFDYDLSLGDEVADGDGNRYKVVEVTNVGEIPGYATELTDYIPDDFELVYDGTWTRKGSKATSAKLENTILNPGESTVLEITFDWKLTENNVGLKTNEAEITAYENEFNAKDLTDDNKDKESMLVSIKTGSATILIIAICVAVLAVIAGIIYKVRKKSEKQKA